MCVTFLSVLARRTVVFVSLTLSVSGCASRSTFVAATSSQPPQPQEQRLNTYALSNGKIKRFIGDPYMPLDPAAKTLLQACRSLPTTSHTAQSVYVMFKSRFGVTPIPALRVGGVTLVLVGSVERMLNGEVDRKTAAILTLPGGTRRAKIGNKWVNLRYPVIAVNGGAETVMALPDLLALFQAADEQRGGGHEIQYVKTQYDLNPALLYPASRR